jgi:hypothetical protein
LFRASLVKILDLLELRAELSVPWRKNIAG